MRRTIKLIESDTIGNPGLVQIITDYRPNNPIIAYRSGNLDTERGLISFSSYREVAKTYANFQKDYGIDTSNAKMYELTLNHPLVICGDRHNSPSNQKFAVDELRASEIYNKNMDKNYDSANNFMKQLGTGSDEIRDYMRHVAIDKSFADVLREFGFDSVIHLSALKHFDDVYEIQVLSEYKNNIKEIKPQEVRQ